jgi:hypothetical protein
MVSTSWLHGLKGILGYGGRARRRRNYQGKARLRGTFVPRLEAFEERTLLSTFTVLNLNDSGSGSLRDAITSANSNTGADTIAFATSLHGTITLTSGELLITDSLTVNGPGMTKLTISGNNASRILETTATAVNVMFSGITMTHGHAADRGGGILNDGSNLTLTNDTVSLNKAVESSPDTSVDAAVGGGIDSLSGNLTITGCQIVGNQALGAANANLDSGSGYAIGGGIEARTGIVTISNSTISNNLALGGSNSTGGGGGGGGIVIGLSGTFTNCIISGNSAIGGAGSAIGPGYGGGIANFGTLTITACSITGNLARGGDGSGYGGAFGGGIYDPDVITAITNSNISNNVARAGDDAPTNYGEGGGIEIDNTSASAVVSHTTFTGNQAIGGNGGTGEFDGEGAGGAIANFGSLSVSAGTFCQNQAIGGSGSNSGSGNADPGVDTAYGGAIDAGFEPTTNTITNSTFSYNQAIGGNDGTATGTDIVEVGDAEGAAICVQLGAVSTISNCILDYNYSQGGNGNTASGPVVDVGAALGGAINSAQGGADIGANTLTVSNSIIAQNSAKGGNNNSGTATVAGLVGAGVGAGIANYMGSSLSVSGSTLGGNQASGGQHNSAAGGGALFTNLGAGGNCVRLDCCSWRRN